MTLLCNLHYQTSKHGIRNILHYSTMFWHHKPPQGQHWLHVASHVLAMSIWGSVPATANMTLSGASEKLAQYRHLWIETLKICLLMFYSPWTLSGSLLIDNGWSNYYYSLHTIANLLNCWSSGLSVASFGNFLLIECFLLVPLSDFLQVMEGNAVLLIYTIHINIKLL